MDAHAHEKCVKMDVRKFMGNFYERTGDTHGHAHHPLYITVTGKHSGNLFGGPVGSVVRASD